MANQIFFFIYTVNVDFPYGTIVWIIIENVV